MPSFDIVSEIDAHELNNAVDQGNREIGTRFDFKGSDASFELNEKEFEIELTAQEPFQLKQMIDILQLKLSKRGIELGSLDIQEPNTQGREAKQIVKVKQGIETPLAKDIVKLIKNSKHKVQTAINGDKLRVTGAKRDDLQQVITLLKQTPSITLPLQFINFRD
jgi:cyclic-di-GMP-binding protein